MARPQNNKQENASVHIDDSTIRPVLDEFGKHLASTQRTIARATTTSSSLAALEKQELMKLLGKSGRGTQASDYA